MRHYNVPSLVWIMACQLIGAKLQLIQRSLIEA